MRIKELESELTNVDENKAQIDRYKQLLLKQRDIMIASSSRLNEWDEQILYLQQELLHSSSSMRVNLSCCC